eukprot:CAMPEP_0118998586 /NCGR_PEP_ID=MMETSP1173-20130426/63145_1 /TAXON_ID=1034831 /ORGANISM="Rhizochromulina marina cf, Strain CCMP1243" /LENGTH=232 /DNA_ID=CAMNT_0006950081 /DNA_START=2105 /DNA_END=2800 /DNA_ORIENTATION=-
MRGCLSSLPLPPRQPPAPAPPPGAPSQTNCAPKLILEPLDLCVRFIQLGAQGPVGSLRCGAGRAVEGEEARGGGDGVEMVPLTVAPASGSSASVNLAADQSPHTCTVRARPRLDDDHHHHSMCISRAPSQANPTSELVLMPLDLCVHFIQLGGQGPLGSLRCGAGRAAEGEEGWGGRDGATHRCASLRLQRFFHTHTRSTAGKRAPAQVCGQGNGSPEREGQWQQQASPPPR